MYNIDTDDDDAGGYQTPQSSVIGQDTPNISNNPLGIYPPPIDVTTLSLGISNAIRSANQASASNIRDQLSNLAPRLQNNIASFMPPSASSASAYFFPTLELPLQPPVPMEIDKPEQTRGRSRTTSRGGHNTPRAPPKDPDAPPLTAGGDFLSIKGF